MPSGEERAGEEPELMRAGSKELRRRVGWGEKRTRKEGKGKSKEGEGENRGRKKAGCGLRSTQH